MQVPYQYTYPSHKPNTGYAPSLHRHVVSHVPRNQATLPTSCRRDTANSKVLLSSRCLPDIRVHVAQRTPCPGSTLPAPTATAAVTATDSSTVTATTRPSEPFTRPGLRRSRHTHSCPIQLTSADDNMTNGTSPAFTSRSGIALVFFTCFHLLLHIDCPPAAQAQLVGSSEIHISAASTNVPRVQRSPSPYDPVSAEEREASSVFSARVETAVQLLEEGRRAQTEGDFEEALRLYTQVVSEDGDLALSSYARVGRALSLYQVGDRSQAILELEDMSLDLKGYPEVHAALAAAFYVDKHAGKEAEKQFTIASLLDKRYTDVDWVASNKHWPPTLVASLRRFLELS